MLVLGRTGSDLNTLASASAVERADVLTSLSLCHTITIFR
jgi:hypothetical protein